MPATFRLADSISQYSSGACAPSPWPRPNCPAGSFERRSGEGHAGHDPASRGHNSGIDPGL